MDNAYYNLNDIFIDNSRLKRTFFQYTYMYHIKHRYQPNMILELVHPDYLKFKVNYIRLNTLNILQNRMGDTKKKLVASNHNIIKIHYFVYKSISDF